MSKTRRFGFLMSKRKITIAGIMKSRAIAHFSAGDTERLSVGFFVVVVGVRLSVFGEAVAGGVEVSGFLRSTRGWLKIARSEYIYPKSVEVSPKLYSTIYQRLLVPSDGVSPIMEPM